MADIKQDLLGLEYSSSFTLQGIQEADINLELPPVTAGLATVYGTVTDGAAPLADATVKLFDSTGTPFQHTLTDANGSIPLVMFRRAPIPSARSKTVICSATGWG